MNKIDRKALFTKYFIGNGTKGISSGKNKFGPYLKAQL
jgi:hypothetical protein